jgi:pSer/pThr/pTyr-binding forkhead associated (FHA) protein
VISGPPGTQREKFYFHGNRSLTIGRLGDFCIPDDRKVSKQHCKLEVVEGECYLTDLQSRNGTVVGGKKITKEKIALETEFKVGDTLLRFQEGHLIEDMLKSKVDVLTVPTSPQKSQI